MDARSIRVPEESIRENYKSALGIMNRAESPAAKDAAAAPGVARFIVPGATSAPVRTQGAGGGTLEHVLRGEGDDPLLAPERHAILVEARRAIAVGTTIGEMVVEPLGFLDLGMRNRNGTLHGADLDRFRALVRVKALVSVFAAAAHLSTMLQASPAGEPADLGEIPLTSSSDSLSWFSRSLAASVRDVPDADLHAAVARACADVMDRAEREAHSAMGEHAAAFASATYAVEADSFHLSGFSRPGAKRKTSLAVQFKKPEEVVGNHIAKAQALRLAKMMACHDFETGKNPFVDLGGFVFTFIGDGNPGTGKTTLIQMTAGLLKQYCDVGGYGFHYENFGVDNISEFQGKSGQNCKAFIDRVLDPRGIGFGTIDDVDQVAGKREDSRSSGGQQEVTAVLMDAFAGANTVVRGNCVFGMFSNYPEKVDPALRQRAGARWLVDGPQTREDYVDILALLLGKNHQIPVGEHDLFASQQIQKMVAQSYDTFSVPSDGKLLAVWERHVRAEGQPMTIASIGAYLHSIKEMDPRFTGRAIKNITDAIKFRAMDFDLPDDWFATPEAFMRLPYDRKLAMISELRKPITVPMILQEVNRYAESELRYADKSDDAEVDGIVRSMRNQSKARTIFAATAATGVEA